MITNGTKEPLELSPQVAVYLHDLVQQGFIKIIAEHETGIEYRTTETGVRVMLLMEDGYEYDDARDMVNAGQN